MGKTSTVARPMRMPGVRFMGDDWAFVSSSGELPSRPKPLFLKAHHRALYPQVFRTLRKPLVPGRLTPPGR
ncbi:hypothetical protein Lesp02_06260 [Lentzea sp. NBRC 105346]|uniref:hypothetical protein n=1 Tax=Lentzea sp. NBRC 105346 TaxID=3032205 RepID=UPI0024A504E4|nr:hypothetical protein [Lentzea sp. NBRC 105346]GLZ28436.1 hypothetical protein Lesp02_06260 [Lentzea sp. NBRC 105346]